MKKIDIVKVYDSNQTIYVRKNHGKHSYRRHISKADARYRILENTMRGYFNYSI